MLAVLQRGARQFAEIVEGGEIEGDSVAERLEQLLEILSNHYGSRQYLADLQILLNLDHDPRTSAEVRATMQQVAQRTHEHLRRLLRDALGPASSVPDLTETIFLALRGFGLSQQLRETMAYDSVPRQSYRVARQRRLLAQALAPFLEEATRQGA